MDMEDTRNYPNIALDAIKELSTFENDKTRLIALRQDLERARNLCFMVSRREKLRQLQVKLSQQIFEKRLSLVIDSDHSEENNASIECDKPFKCDMCDKSYVLRYSLNIHALLIHEKIHRTVPEQEFQLSFDMKTLQSTKSAWKFAIPCGGESSSAQTQEAEMCLAEDDNYEIWSEEHEKSETNMDVEMDDQQPKRSDIYVDHVGPNCEICLDKPDYESIEALSEHVETEHCMNLEQYGRVWPFKMPDKPDQEVIYVL